MSAVEHLALPQSGARLDSILRAAPLLFHPLRRVSLQAPLMLQVFGMQALQAALTVCASPWRPSTRPPSHALQTLLTVCASPASEYRPDAGLFSVCASPASSTARPHMPCRRC